MSKKIDLNDFGRLVKPRILTEAFLLCNFDHIDLHNWWKQVLVLDMFSKSYKKDTIVSNYGLKLNELFEGLDIENYVASIISFIVLHDGKYKLVSTTQEAEILFSMRKKFYIRAVGIEIFKKYNRDTKEVYEPWESTQKTNITWFYKLKHIIPVEIVEQHNDVETGDLIIFSKTQALVTNVKVLKRTKFYSTCSWTKKKITVLSGNKAYQVRLDINRPFEIIKPQQ